MWSVPNGKTFAELRGHEEDIRALAFGREGKTLLSAAADMTIRHWDLGTSDEVHKTEFELSGHWMKLAAFSPDGSKLAVSSGVPVGTVAKANEPIDVFDTRTDKKLQAIPRSHEHVRYLAFSPDGMIMATAGSDHFILWDIATGSALGLLKATAMSSLAFSPDGKSLASVSGWGESTLRIWDVGTRRERLRLRGWQLRSAAFSPDGKAVAAAGKSISIWDSDSGRPLREFVGHEYDVSSLKFSSDGKLLASASWLGSVRVWEAATGRPVHNFASRAGHKAFGSGPEFLAVCVASEAAEVWSVADARKLHMVALPDRQPIRLALSPDGSVVGAVYSTYPRDVHLWDTKKGEELRVLKGHGTTTPALAFSPAGGLLASTRYDEVLLWDLLRDTGPVKTGKGPSMDKVLAFQRSGQIVAAGGRNGQVRWFEAATGAETHRVKGPREDYTALPITGDGYYEVKAVAVSPDGSTIASAMGPVRLWDAKTGKQIACIDEHEGHVTSLAFSPDGRWLASGSADTTVLIWDIELLKRTKQASEAALDTSIVETPRFDGAAVWYNAALERRGGAAASDRPF